MSDADLMQQIFNKYHGGILAPAVTGKALPESFLAALVANESGGNSSVTRFEPAVFLALAEVLIATKSSYSPAGIAHPLGAADLISYAWPADGVPPGVATPPIAGGFMSGLKRLQQLATSYGLTQIMGWHAIEMSKSFGVLTGGPVGQIGFTVELLTYFANRYTLDMSRDFEQLFRCWNTGQPLGATFDIAYVPNGLHRMGVYDSLIPPPPAVIGA
jgi:hypothetical protein